MATGLFVAYYRVSTDRQGQSGLGLDAQRKAVADYLNGGKWKLAGEFTEVESGKRCDRPQLAAALALCRREKATLIVAKLDRLARNVHFISGLMESGADFIAVDMPHANRLTIHILAAVAEDERRRISERTRAALAVAKSRGTVLGNPRLPAANRAAALAQAASLRLTVNDLRAQGLRSARAIADELNRRNVPTARGRRWHANAVNLLLHRIDGSQPADAKRTRRTRRPRCRRRSA